MTRIVESEPGQDPVVTDVPDEFYGTAQEANSGSGSGAIAANPMKYLGLQNFDFRNGTALGAGFFFSRSLIIPMDCTIKSVMIPVIAAVATAELTPAIYATNPDLTMAANLAKGPTVVGVSAGLNELLLDAPLNVLAGTPIFFGLIDQVAAISLGTSNSSCAAYFAQANSVVPAVAPAASYAARAWTSMFLKLV